MGTPASLGYTLSVLNENSTLKGWALPVPGNGHELI